MQYITLIYQHFLTFHCFVIVIELSVNWNILSGYLACSKKIAWYGKVEATTVQITVNNELCSP